MMAIMANLPLLSSALRLFVFFSASCLGVYMHAPCSRSPPPAAPPPPLPHPKPTGRRDTMRGPNAGAKMGAHSVVQTIFTCMELEAVSSSATKSPRSFSRMAVRRRHILRMPRNATKCHEMPRNATKCHEMPRSATKCHEMPRNATKCHEAGACS